MQAFRSRVLMCVAAAVTFALAAPAPAEAQTPGAPTGLTYVVNGSTVTLQWTHATGTFTHYVLEAGSAPGAANQLVFSTTAFVDPSKQPEKLASFTATNVGPGTYYVRIRGANGNAQSDPSNEVAITVGGACQAPPAPTQFTAITRGTNVWLMWNPGSGRAATAYEVLARVGGGVVAALPVTTPYLNVGGVPAGTYAVTVRAANSCGTSAESNSVTVTANSNSAARTANAGAGERLPQPYVRDLVLAVGAEAQAAGLLNGALSCPDRPGYTDIEARKVNLNAYINFMVDRLRQFDERFGYNAKPTRAQYDAIVAGDEIAYHYGSDPAEGSPNVYLVDTLFGHCTFGREGYDYRVFYNEFGRWTGAGRFTGWAPPPAPSGPQQ